MDTLRFKGARHAARIDQQVGDRIRKRRTILGFTQEQLAEALDISYQQIQKYETGANRVSAGRLFQIAQRLEVPISFFFEELGIDYSHDGSNVGGNRATFELVRNFSQIPDTSVRIALSGLVKSLASVGEAGTHGYQSEMLADHSHSSNGAGSGAGNGNGATNGGNGKGNGNGGSDGNGDGHIG